MSDVHELKPPEDKFFHVTAVNLISGEKTPLEIPITLPKPRTFRRKIRMIFDILFDRTYKR